MRFALLSALAFAVTGAAHAQAVEPEPEDIVVSRKIADANKRVCKSSVATGSIMPKRVCRTKGEWEEIRERSIATLEATKREMQARRHVQESRSAAGGN